MKSKTALRVLISVGVLALLATQLAVPNLRLDAVALGLVVLAVLRWLSSIIQSANAAITPPHALRYTAGQLVAHVMRGWKSIPLSPQKDLRRSIPAYKLAT
jgi:hypothetical protein